MVYTLIDAIVCYQINEIKEDINGGSAGIFY